MSLRKASTQHGSKWVPRSRISWSTAASGGQAFLYGRSDVRESKTSATATIRLKMGIFSPASPEGYPEPSNFSWWERAMSARSDHDGGASASSS